MYFDITLPGLTAEADSHSRMELEAEFCRNFVCCGVTLRDLHELLEHHEDIHSPGPASGDPSLESYYGVGPPGIPPSVDTPPQSPCFWDLDALPKTQIPARAAAHNPALDGRLVFAAAELDSPTAESLARTPVTDSGYASPGGGPRTSCATEDEFHWEENRGAAKSYSAYFGRVVQSSGANVGAAAAAAAAARGMKRRLDRRNSRDEPAALAASPSVNLYLVTEKLSVGNSVFPSASSGLSYPSPVASPPAELAYDVFTASADLGVRRGSPSSHCRDPRVAGSQAEELVESDTPSATPALQSSPDLLRHRSSETKTVRSASRSRSGCGRNKKPWPCPVLSCTRRFRLAGGLKYHIQSRHLAGSEASRRTRVAPRPSQDVKPPGNAAS